MTEPGALIGLEGTMNSRDIGGWTTVDGGSIRRGVLYRSDRLSDLTDADHRVLDDLGIRTVIDLRYQREVTDHPSRLWAGVEHHLEIPMAGELADQKSFIERAFAGELAEISDEAVGTGYIEMLAVHAVDFGRAIDASIERAPTLFHCTAGKDRTGLFTMLVLSTSGVSDADILSDFELSNRYRAERRMAELAPTFAEQGLDVEDFRPALSAPRLAMEMALEWIEAEHGSARAYLETETELGPDGVERIRTTLVGN